MHQPPIPTTLAERNARLKGLHARLRASHFGIDAEIQRLLDAFAPWYRFAETQSRPRTIGLWGMTGTGKSSLVRALVRECGLENRTHWLDAGESGDREWMEVLNDSLETLPGGTPLVLVMDEFQHARTVRNGMEERESVMLRRFWEMLDTGRVVTRPYADRHDLDAVRAFQASFKDALKAGVKVQGGKVVEGWDAFSELMKGARSRFAFKERWALPENIWSAVRSAQPDPALTDSAVREKLGMLDAQGILNWTDQLIDDAQSTRVLDASKFLVILLGNLDELYAGEKEPVAELDPDVLLHRHRDIGLAGVQSALLRMFRLEQVGRMGTSHVIFPPIGRATIDALVRHDVEELAARLSAHCGRAIAVDDALVEHLRSSSAIAVFGARPVVQAVQNTVPLLLSQALEHPAWNGAQGVRLGVVEAVPVALFDHGSGTTNATLAWPSGDQRSERAADPMAAHIAVHETGHLLCGVLLRKLKPLQVCVRTRDPLVGGFVAWDKLPERQFLRSEIVPQLAMILGGLVAEELRFGTDGMSAGSGNDLKWATELALGMVKKEGMGADRLHYAEHATQHGIGFRTTLADAEAQARPWIHEAEKLAKATLLEHRPLFDRCVELLLEKGNLGMKELEGLLAG